MTRDQKFGIKDVIEGDCCIGCGGCVAANANKASIHLGAEGLYLAELSNSPADQLDRICPFSDFAPNENEVGAAIYGKMPSHASEIGYYKSLYAGRVASDEFRINSSSGGLVSWLASRLLETGTVDGVIHVKSSGGMGAPMFEFGISRSIEEIHANRKSIYYPVEFSSAIQSARESGGRFAFIGIPCHIKAIRLLQLEDDWARDNISHTIGLVCGHMKGTGFSEALAWQVGVPPENLLNVDFRVKDTDAPANRYRFAAFSSAGSSRRERPNFELVGSNWGHAFFQPNACNYCDDIFAECADICLGDAWLPRYESDSLGHNVVVVRSEFFDNLLRQGESDSRVVLEELNEREVIETQAGNIRHRRIGLSVRLADDDAEGTKHPVKRVPPTYDTADEKRISIVRLRRESSALSFLAFAEAKKKRDLKEFYRIVGPIMRRYDRVSATRRSTRIIALVPVQLQGRVRRLYGRVNQLVKTVSSGR